MKKIKPNDVVLAKEKLQELLDEAYDSCDDGVACITREGRLLKRKDGPEVFIDAAPVRDIIKTLLDSFVE